MSSIQKPCIFGVKIDNISKNALFSYIQDLLSSKGRYQYIVTINPEILIKSRNSSRYKDILNASALNIVDGIGIRFALLRRGKHLKTRLTGSELMHEVLREVNNSSGRVFLAVRADGLSAWRDVRDVLTVLYPHILFTGKDVDSEKYDIVSMNISADVVLSNFGAPEQEIFLSKLNSEHAKMGMGIGGAFDYLTGALPRAPHWMRSIGLEWLYRLYRQPHRWKRIVNAVIIFPILVLFNRS